MLLTKSPTAKTASSQNGPGKVKTAGCLLSNYTPSFKFRYAVQYEESMKTDKTWVLRDGSVDLRPWGRCGRRPF